MSTIKETLPREVAKEIENLSVATKLQIMYELSDELVDKLPDHPDLISATTTQNLKALTLDQSLIVIADLASMIRSYLNNG